MGDYPTEDELQRIRDWGATGYGDCAELLAYVKSLWWSSDWGWSEEDGWLCSPGDTSVRENESRTYRVSTGGWSGNEDLIGAMQDNHMFWMLAWWSSRRGGHHEFVVKSEVKGG